MTLREELESEVRKIFRESWSVRDGTKVPDTQDIRLGNEGVKLDGTVLYADLAQSTALVTGNDPKFAAEVYKTYLSCAARIIRSHGGLITAYDGDRIMAVFIGGSKNTSAAKTALKINYAVQKIVNPLLHAQYPDRKGTLEVKQVVGIDTSELLVARTGIRGSNDLVWVGRAANYAAKLCDLRSGYASYLTGTVYNKMAEDAKVGSNGGEMWERRNWTDYNIPIYRSNWTWTV